MGNDNKGIRQIGQPEFDYPIRVSELGKAELISVSDASTVQFGDRAELNASLRGLAVQRETDHFHTSDVYFESYNIFQRPRPVFIPEPADADGDVRMRTINECPRISVGCVYVIAISAAASVLVGNMLTGTCDSRIQDIRQYAAPPHHPPLSR